MNHERTDLFSAFNAFTLIILAPDRRYGRCDGCCAACVCDDTFEALHVHVGYAAAVWNLCEKDMRNEESINKSIWNRTQPH